MILLDNAAWHTSALMKHRLAKLGVPILYSGPYSYSAAAVEMVFAALKLGDLNPDRFPTGKKGKSILYTPYSPYLYNFYNL